MSNPAIVLMTDPSRCSLGDVHYLLQALREMQQMGEHAQAQAFCDHPASAEGFVAAYAHAYPKLVLEDAAIPTPGHLQSLIASGQIGAFGQPLDGAPGAQMAPGMARPAEQSGLGAFPIVVLTLGPSQVLADAMQQSPAIKDHIRLIDIAPDGVENVPVSIAEVVGGLDGEQTWESDGLGDATPELDEVAGASFAGSADLALDEDPMDLDVVETADAPAADGAGYGQVDEDQAATAEPAAASEPEPTILVDAAAEAAPPEETYEASPVTESVAELADPLWSSDDDAAEPEEVIDESDEVALEADEMAEGGDGAGSEKGGEPKDPDGEDLPDIDLILERGVLGDGDVDYPPVGELAAGADLPYPALDQAAAPGAVLELATVMMDDAIFNTERVLESLPADVQELSPADVDMIEQATIRSSGANIEDLYGSLDDESEEVFSESPPPQDTDL